MHRPEHSLYAQHVATLRRRFDEALAATGYDAVLIGAGLEGRYFADDHGPPFRANPQLQQWLPADAHPGACLLYRPGRPPVAVLTQPCDFWHLPPELPGSPWADELEIRAVSRVEAVTDALPQVRGRVALLGPADQWASQELSGQANPETLVNHLAFQRAVKTAWEVDCLRGATDAAVAGHRAAASAWADGADEFGILLAFLGASRQAATELPYQAIVAADRHAATLHYQYYERDTRPRYSLLIDAGCSRSGYASDVTRTHARPEAPEFAELIAAMDQLQQILCRRVTPGLPFARLHHAAHVLLGHLLARHGLVDAAPEALVATGVTQLFFPHGLGHLLGLQVHDVGGRLAGPDGTTHKAPDAYPSLRLLRNLEAGFTLTIEPGLYFIESLLEQLRHHELAARVNWPLIERLKPCGGIRIEDNVLVTEDGADNLTRAAFDTAASTT